MHVHSIFLFIVLSTLLSFQPQARTYNRILCIGNSLTVANPTESLQWPGYHGMAATQPDRDYCHRLQLLLAAQQGFVPELAIVSTDVNRWPSNPTGKLLFGGEQTAADFAADLVIVQMGDNAKADIPFEQWLEVYAEIEAWTPNARRIALGVWSANKPQHEDYIRRTAAETGMQYIEIRDLHAPETEASQHHNPGVSWHPNDLGMSRIAERIMRALASVYLPGVSNGEGGGTIPNP